MIHPIVWIGIGVIVGVVYMTDQSIRIINEVCKGCSVEHKEDK